MIAVIINGAATALGAVLGVILKKGVPEHVSKAVFSAIGLCLAVMAIQGAIQTENILLMVLSIAIGVAVGTVLAIEDRMQSFGLWLRNRMKAGGDSNFVEAFVTLSVMQVVGAMAILGPIPETFSTRVLKKSLSAESAKPYNDCESSRYTASVCSITSSPRRGNFSAVVTGMLTS